jgi:hypothetical protein
MTSIPVIAGVSVTERPVTAKAYEQVLAVVVRIHIPEREPWPTVVTNREAIPRPDNPAADTVVVVSVNVVTVISATYQIRPVVIDHS